MSPFVSGPVRVRVPATSANLGPGFDALGLALGLYDELEAQVADALSISVEGEGARDVPLDERHLVHRAMVRGFEALDVPVPHVRLHCRNVIPHGRGLGSSSAAIVGGLALARALVADGSILDEGSLFALAAEIEGHPDNVAPAVFGGFTVAYAEESSFRAVRLDPVPLTLTAFVPSEPLSTERARGLLPATVPHADAARNAGRAALMVVACTQYPALLLTACEDRLHQGYRASAMPRSLELVGALRSAGVPAVVSGAGPTVLALGAAGSVDDLSAYCPDGWCVLDLSVDSDGVRTE